MPTTDGPIHFIDNNSSDVIVLNRCESREDGSYLVFISLPALVILLNTFLLVAIVRKAKESKVQNVSIFRHVSSTLVANTIFCIFVIVQIFYVYYGTGRPGEEFDLTSQDDIVFGLWTFAKALVSGIFVIQSINLGLLIDAIRFSMCRAIIISSVKRASESEDENKSKLRLSRSTRSLIYIWLSWILPLLCMVLLTLQYNCAESCNCITTCLPTKGNMTSQLAFINGEENFAHQCSRLWPPMPLVWLLVIVIAWSMCFLLNLLWMYRSSRQVNMIWKSYLNSTVRASFHGQKDMLNDDTELKNGDLEQNSESHSNGSKKNSKAGFTRQTSNRPSRNLRESPTYRLRYVVGLLIMFVVSSAPSMALFLLEVINPAMDFSPYANLINILFQMAFLYMMVCPFILIKCLPQVKVAISALLLCMCPTTL